MKQEAKLVVFFDGHWCFCARALDWTGAEGYLSHHALRLPLLRRGGAAHVIRLGLGSSW